MNACSFWCDETQNIKHEAIGADDAVCKVKQSIVEY